MTFTSYQLRVIFDILVKECGANSTEKEAFVYHISRGCQEYRCCWALGFGGKFYPDSGIVTYYEEDRTPERELILGKTNRRLQTLIEVFKGEISDVNTTE